MSGGFELVELFDKYKKVGVEGGSDEKDDCMEGEAIVKFCEELGVSVEDPVILVVAWKIEAKTPYQFSRMEFVQGFANMGLNTLKEIKAKIPTWRQCLKASTKEFRPLYAFVFGFSLPEITTKFLPAENAGDLWKMVLVGRFGLLDKWCTFVTDVHKKPVNKDLWMQTYDFATQVEEDLSNFNSEDSWHTIIDEFVEWHQGQKK